MNCSVGIGAYMTVMNHTLSGRQLESHVLLRTADRLQQVIDLWGTPGHEERASDAVTRTQALWSVLQDAIASEENPLPDEVKKNLLALSLFIDRRLLEFCADPSPDKLEAVVSVHRELAAGLAAHPSETSEED